MSGQTDRLLGLVGNLGIKFPVRAASTAALTLSGEQTVDGVALVTDDRVLVKDQASSINNGIYVVDTGDWARDKDCDGTYDLVQGSLVLVYSGTTNGNKIFKCTTADPIVVGTSSLVFVGLSYELTGSSKTIWCGTATGTANALVLTPANAIAAGDLNAGLTLLFKSGGAGNSAATTINTSGTGAIAAQSNGAAMVGGEIEASKWYRATLDASGAALQVERIAPALLLDMFVSDGFGAYAIGDGKVASLAPPMGFNLVGGYLDWTVAANALTCAVKTWSGADPSAAEPVFYAVRDVAATGGALTYRKLTAATSVTINNTALIGTVNSVAFRLWAVMFNDAGTDRLAIINCLSSVAGSGAGRDITAIYPLTGWGIASATLSDNAADNAQVFYANAAVASKAYSTLGYATWESGQAAAGVWATAASRKQLFGPGQPLPGCIVQEQGNDTGAVATGSTVVPYDDTIPQSGEGDQYMSQAITPSSAANVLQVEHSGMYAHSGTNNVTAALFQDATANAIAATSTFEANAGSNFTLRLFKKLLASLTTATTFKVRACGTANTTTFNGSAGGRIFGGVANSFIGIKEIMG